MSGAVLVFGGALILPVLAVLIAVVMAIVDVLPRRSRQS